MFKRDNKRIKTIFHTRINFNLTRTDNHFWKIIFCFASEPNKIRIYKLIKMNIHPDQQYHYFFKNFCFKGLILSLSIYRYKIYLLL